MKDYLKVLHVNECGSVTKDIVQGLRNLGIESDIYQPTIGTYRASKLKRALLPILRTWESLKLYFLVKQRLYNVVHVHYASLAYMTIIARIPYFLHCHGSDLRRDLYRPALGTITREAIRKAIRVFYVTPDLKKYLDPFRSDTIFLPNPIDLEKFKPLSNIEQSKPRILCISKMEPFKGVERIIQIINRIWEVRPEVEVAIFNFGNSSIVKDFISEHQQDSRLILLSRIPHDKMPELIGSFRVILGQQHPNVGALGLSELEAMACGKPVVCHFNYPDAYPQPPPIIASHTPEEAAAHILHLLDDKKLCLSLGKEARRWVSTYHNPQSIIQTLVNYYRQYLVSKIQAV